MAALFAILAGGRATRLGGEKVGAVLGGRPLIYHPLDAAIAAAGVREAEVAVVAKPGTKLPEPPSGLRLLREAEQPVHPICGIVTALHEAGGEPVVAVAADMPFVTPELLRWLAGLADPIAVPSHAGRLHPLIARYSPAALPALEAALEEEAALQETVASLSPRLVSGEELSRFGEAERLLFNVNTPGDLHEAERMLIR